ncbi:histidine kinase dimerization/phosphoacceptor domain -containing protein [Paraburkholderia sp.]|jgi:two-component sensor histidine kinase|uniref:histidine kinase dimerization/phosphoacceptor domain -containing protein n=1 Tax=Paraburkholderia sp. TaxID=1926495 RepID=UPI002F40A947
MSSAQIATLAASLRHIVADPSDTVRTADVLRQGQLFADMIERTQGDVALQQVLDDATQTAAQGCFAAMAKVLELDRSNNTLVIKSQYGLSHAALGQPAGKAEPGNPPGEALKSVAPVVDPDVRRRPPDSLPKVLAENGVVTSVNLPLVNYEGAYGVLEVDFREPTEIGPLQLTFLASIAGVLAENIEKTHARAALAAERDAKAVLLREQQHRIRNNFQLIIAMVQRNVLRARDDDTRRSFRDIERRVFAMASLYDHLLGLNEQEEHADLGRYLSTMAANFDDLYDLVGNGISLTIKLQFGIIVGLDTCTTVGTIVNELVANSVEHAFDGTAGHITVSLSRSDDKGCLVCVTDDGRGLSGPAVDENTGLRTVRNMLTGIGGRLDLETGPGKGMRWSLRLGASEVR